MPRRRARKYKTVTVNTKNMGSAGAQILLGSYIPMDETISFGYLNNVVATGFMNDGENNNGGICFYLTRQSNWADSDVITARATQLGGGTVNLSAKQKVSGEVFDDMPGGRIYVWAELTDVTLTDDVEIRYVLEAWGRFIRFIST